MTIDTLSAALDGKADRELFVELYATALEKTEDEVAALAIAEQLYGEMEGEPRDKPPTVKPSPFKKR